MADLIAPTAERESLGNGVYRTTVHLAPVAYADASGVLRRIVADWSDGDGTYPHVVSAARMRVRTAPNGDRLLLPVPGDDDAWFSISSPFINVGGNWTQPSLGTFTRTGNRLRAQTANVDTYIWHLGHGVKAGFELKNGWLPANGQFAFRVGLNGLTRDGGTLLYNGTPVMSLRKPVAYDWNNPADTREIAHEFVQFGGNWHVLFTLPDTTGMDRVVVDPTFTAQPDGTAGEDTRIESSAPTTNYGTAGAPGMAVGELNAGAAVERVLIRFDLSTLPADATISSTTLSLYATLDNSSNARTFRVYRQKRVWVESQATWNIYSTGNNWSTAGGFHADDCEQTDIGSRAFTATETVNEFKDFSLTATAKTDLDYGLENAGSATGWLIKADTESDDAYWFVSSDGATASQRPKLVIEYTSASGVSIPAIMHHRRQQGMS